MKSLEFINSKIKQIKKDLYKLGKTKEGTDKDFYKYVLTEGLKDYQCVKQDLEVLEILRKKIKFTYSDHFTGVIIEGKEENYDKNIVIFNQEEYEKVYEWLEEYK